MIVVANAGPLIALAQIGRFEILKQLYEHVYLPVAVQQEVAGTGESRPGAEDVTAADWITVKTVKDRTAVTLLRERLDLGESEAVALALEMQADLLLIDEARGRRVAETQGIRKTGTIGTLLAAKTRGLITEVGPSLDALTAQGFRMDDELYAKALQLAGESV